MSSHTVAAVSYAARTLSTTVLNSSLTYVVVGRAPNLATVLKRGTNKTRMCPLPPSPGGLCAVCESTRIIPTVVTAHRFQEQEQEQEQQQAG